MQRFYIRGLLITAAFSFLFFPHLVDAAKNPKKGVHPLESGWNVMGFTLEGVDTVTWIKMNERGMALCELRESAGKIIAQFGLTLKNTIKLGGKGDYNYLSFEGVQSDGTIVIGTLQSCPAGDNYQTQLGIYTTKRQPAPCLHEYLQHLQTLVRMWGSPDNMKVIFSGSRKGVLNSAQVRSLSQKVFDKLGAKATRIGMESQSNSVYKAYSPILGNESMKWPASNVELDFGYDKIHRITVIRLATPENDAGV